MKKMLRFGANNQSEVEVDSGSAGSGAPNPVNQEVMVLGQAVHRVKPTVSYLTCVPLPASNRLETARQTFSSKTLGKFQEGMRQGENSEREQMASRTKKRSNMAKET